MNAMMQDKDIDENDVFCLEPVMRAAISNKGNSDNEFDKKIENDDTLEANQISLADENKLLNSLLSTPTASTVVDEKMIIRTEVVDTQLNVKKILYRSDEQKDHNTLPPNNQTIVEAEPHNDDDERRLVIDVSDDERGASRHIRRTKEKSMPLLDPSMTTSNNNNKQPAPISSLILPTRLSARHNNSVQNNLFKSITYNLDLTDKDNSSKVKIDILAPSLTVVNQTNTSSKTTDKIANSHRSPSKTALSSMDELNIIGNEIDKQITKKTNEIMELLRQYLSDAFDKTQFATLMSTTGAFTTNDFFIITKKLVKKHKYIRSPNHNNFMKMKKFYFQTSAEDLVVYFENLTQSVTREKFLNMIKFYEIITKEMLNLNKSKILQYLLDFMIVRKNTTLDMLDYNYEGSFVTPMEHSSSDANFQLPDSTQNVLNNRQTRVRDTSYSFNVRSDPIYLTASSCFVTQNRDVISCKMSSRCQKGTYEWREFDDNILLGRRTGRKILKSPDDENIQKTKKTTNTLQRDAFSISHQPIQRSSTPILVESDTPPPSIPSEPPSPTIFRIQRVNMQVMPQHSSENKEHVQGLLNEIPKEKPQSTSPYNKPIRQPVKRRLSVRGLENLGESSVNLDTKEMVTSGHITINEVEILNKNGTDIIPTSMVPKKRRHTIENEQSTPDNVEQHNRKVYSSVLEEHLKSSVKTSYSSENSELPTAFAVAELAEESTVIDSSIEETPIGKNYMQYYYEFEERQKLQEIKKKMATAAQLQYGYPNEYDQKRTQRHLSQFKKNRFLDETNGQSLVSPRITHDVRDLQAQNNYAMHHRMESQRMQPYPVLQRSAAKQHHPGQIDYNQYQMHFERVLRERGGDLRIENHQNGNLEVVSTIPPERYHQQDHRTQHYGNQISQPTTPCHSQDSQQRTAPSDHRRTAQVDSEAAVVAYHQLNQLQMRDPTIQNIQQYNEYYKNIDQLKMVTPSAFSMFQGRSSTEQRPSDIYYQNSQEINHNFHPQANNIPAQISPPRYQISSSSSSREESPVAYEVINSKHERISLQRKLKYKSKSSKYVEPNTMTKPFYNPAHSTYYAEPYALTKHRTSSANEPSASLQQHSEMPSENIVVSSNVQQHSPVVPPANYQWFYAAQHVPIQNLSSHNQPAIPARPIPRPPVPPFAEQLQMHVRQNYPTEFLRNYYENSNKSYNFQ